ncbi:MAG: EF2563 family selenium-dependent molybdenum hydroxylase system protein [Deltaproteobacteria bacterium]|nr:EF2563 family selenium-dependent molybdenum hydroxylase system protein [Deltaproteobacteria bacterium]
MTISNPFDIRVLIRGGGEMASGIAHRLYQCHMQVLITEVAEPVAVRRSVAFAEAVYRGRHTIENVTAVRVGNFTEALSEWQRGAIPVFIDPQAQIHHEMKPAVIVDATMSKSGGDSKLDDAPLVIGIGPGFCAGDNVHAVIESNRGYHLGRVIWQGAAEPDTGVPAPVAGHTEARVLRAPRSGCFKSLRDIGDRIGAGEIVAEVDGAPVRAEIAGLIRGMLHDGIQIGAGVKVGDIDPRGESEYCDSISDKARAIGGGVVEAIFHSYPRLKNSAT